MRPPASVACGNVRRGWGVNQDQTIIALGEALCRCRALTDPESRMLERAIRREDVRANGARTKRWTPQDDQTLLKAAGSVKPEQIAVMLSRTVPSVRIRIGELRKRERAAVCGRKRARVEERV